MILCVVAKTMLQTAEQYSAAEIHWRIFTAYGLKDMSKAVVRDWICSFWSLANQTFMTKKGVAGHQWSILICHAHLYF